MLPLPLLAVLLSAAVIAQKNPIERGIQLPPNPDATPVATYLTKHYFQPKRLRRQAVGGDSAASGSTGVTGGDTATGGSTTTPVVSSDTGTGTGTASSSTASSTGERTSFSLWAARSPGIPEGGGDGTDQYEGESARGIHGGCTCLMEGWPFRSVGTGLGVDAPQRAATTSAFFEAGLPLTGACSLAVWRYFHYHPFCFATVAGADVPPPLDFADLSESSSASSSPTSTPSSSLPTSASASSSSTPLSVSSSTPGSSSSSGSASSSSSASSSQTSSSSSTLPCMSLSAVSPGVAGS